MKKNGKFYVNFVIKNYVLNFFMIFIGLVLFLFMLSSIKLENTARLEGIVNQNGLCVINTSNLEVESATVYVYTDRNEEVYQLQADSVTMENGIIWYFFLDEIALEGFPEKVSVEIITGHESLLYRIFIKAGKNI